MQISLGERETEDGKGDEEVSGREEIIASPVRTGTSSTKSKLISTGLSCHLFVCYPDLYMAMLFY